MSRDQRDNIDPCAHSGADELDQVGSRDHVASGEHVASSEPVEPRESVGYGEQVRPREAAGALETVRSLEHAHDDIGHVASLEVELLDPAVRCNADRLSELLHPDFVEHGASSRIRTRHEIIDELPLEDATTPPTTAADLVAKHLTDDVILVTYRTTSTL